MLRDFLYIEKRRTVRHSPFYFLETLSLQNPPRIPRPTNGYKMSTASTTVAKTTSTVDHIVFHKVKDDTDPTKINDMISNLDGLFSLGLVLNRTVGPIYRNDTSSASQFTHMIHSRFSSVENLRAYTLHPAHVSVANEYVFPICDDSLVVDWVVDDLEGPLAPPVGSAMKVSLFKLKEDAGNGAKDETLGVLKETSSKESVGGGVQQVTFGENISPMRAQGYSIGSLVLFQGVSELEAVDSNGEEGSLVRERIKQHLESAIVVDYVVPSQ